uniref:Uncharacterized protein n=1 Tax=Psilocybe cubensis TaxID=181762 RepID=A0A8H7Y562_PSICU
MSLKIRSSLLIVAVLALSTMVTSKPTSRHHHRHEAKVAAAKNLKPLKQFNPRQQHTKRTEIAFIPKPKPSVTITYIPTVATGTAKAPVPIIQGPSDASKNLPGIGPIIQGPSDASKNLPGIGPIIQGPSDTSKNLPGIGPIISPPTNGNPPTVDSKAGDLVDGLLKNVFGDSKPLNPLSDTKANTNLPKVGSDPSPLRTGIELSPLKDKDDQDGKVSYVVDSDLGPFDHSFNAHSRRDEVDSNDEADVPTN